MNRVERQLFGAILICHISITGSCTEIVRNRFEVLSISWIWYANSSTIPCPFECVCVCAFYKWAENSTETIFSNIVDNVIFFVCALPSTKHRTLPYFLPYRCHLSFSLQMHLQWYYKHMLHTVFICTVNVYDNNNMCNALKSIWLRHMFLSETCFG